MINIASWFSAYKLLTAQLTAVKHELRRERRLSRVRECRFEEERQKYVDALARAAGKPEVFNRPPQAKPVPSLLIGPRAIAANHFEQEQAPRSEIVSKEELERTG